jgi:hypothetical protein
VEIINKKLSKILLFSVATGHCALAYGTQTPFYFTEDPFELLAYRPIGPQSALRERYCPLGAFCPMAVRYPGNSLFDSVVIDEHLVLDGVEEETFREMKQSLAYLRKNVLKSDEKALAVLGLAEKELQQARREGIGRKGNYASIRVVDELVSVAAHLLKNCSLKRKMEELKRLLLRIAPRVGPMACNHSAAPYLENIEKNMAIASRVLEIDPNLLKIDRGNLAPIDWSLLESDPFFK